MDAPHRVVIVEDNPLEATHMRWLIRDAGCTVDVAGDGRQGLELVRRAVPAVVVTDIQMPVMDGLELTARLQDEFPSLPVVVTTGVGSEDAAAEALHRGAVSYVPKNRIATMLAPAVRRLVRRAYARNALRRVEPFVTGARVSLQVGNDDALVPHLVCSLLEQLRSYGFCEERDLMQIGTALDECLLNAMLHGNLEVGSALRELERGRAYRDLIRRRRQEQPYASRRVTITLDISPNALRFEVADEGPGFDPESVPDPTTPVNIERASGRGLLLIRTFMDEVTFNDRANVITMVKQRRRAAQLEAVAS